MNDLQISIKLHSEEHAAPYGHPETAGRFESIARLLAPFATDKLASSERSSINQILRVHDSQMIERIELASNQAVNYLDPDTYVTSGSFSASLTVTSMMLDAIDVSFGNGPTKHFIIARPPGHHAERKRSMGFCLVNHLAVAAQYAIDEHDVKRVAIIDFDVHHGNGTQDIFYSQSDVLYLSTHQFPFYPGTGLFDEKGAEEGVGYTLNYPMPAGTCDAEYAAVWHESLIPAVLRYEPELLLLSAGFDGHKEDPLGGFDLTGETFEMIGRTTRDLSEEVCGGSIVMLTEGGYSSSGNYDGIVSFLRGIGLEL